MPEMPAFLADVLEPRFARPATVSSVEDIAPRVRRVRFAGPALRGVDFHPGQEVEFRVGPRAFRHYSLAAFDRSSGSFDVVFFLNGRGPGSEWASRLEPGQRVGVLGPGGRFRLDDDASTHVFLGDETCLGVFRIMREAARGETLGAIEVDEGDGGLLERAGVGLDVAPRRAWRGAGLPRFLDGCGLLPTPGVRFYLSGHARTIRELRHVLLRRGWSRSAIRVKAYWDDDKRGL